MILSTLLTAFIFISGVAAHGAVTSYVIGGTTYPGYKVLSNPIPYDSPC